MPFSSKLADEHLLTNPLTLTRVLNALTSMLTVDSTFTNSQILSQATHLGGLTSSTEHVHHRSDGNG